MLCSQCHFQYGAALNVHKGQILESRVQISLIQILPFYCHVLIFPVYRKFSAMESLSSIKYILVKFTYMRKWNLCWGVSVCACMYYVCDLNIKC